MTISDLKLILLKTEYFIDNRFLDMYCQIILDNLETIPIKYKTERHHFITICYYAITFNEKNRKINEMHSRDDNNIIVHLSHFDHLLVHYYLYFCTLKELKVKLCVAFAQMTYCN